MGGMGPWDAPRTDLSRFLDAPERHQKSAPGRSAPEACWGLRALHPFENCTLPSIALFLCIAFFWWGALLWWVPRLEAKLLSSDPGRQKIDQDFRKIIFFRINVRIDLWTSFSVFSWMSAPFLAPFFVIFHVFCITFPTCF